MEHLYSKTPIYPLLSFIASTAIFFFGLMVSKDIAIVYFIVGLTCLYLVFGYKRALLKSIFLFFIIGGVVGAGAALTSMQWQLGVQTFGRILLLAYASIVMIALPPVLLTRNLVQLKFPRILTLGMLITIRFIPILLEESRHIREAMKSRGAQINGSYLYRAFLLPFIMRILTMSDIMSISLETRGFSITEHRNTLYKPVVLTIRDVVFGLSLCLIMMGVFVIWKK